MRIWDQTRDFSARNRLENERLHKVAWDELNRGIRRDGLWAQALVVAAGDEKAAVAAYIKLRVTALRDEESPLNADRSSAERMDPDPAVDLPGMDHGSYFDWRGFIKMLGIAVAVIAAFGLLAAAFD